MAEGFGGLGSAGLQVDSESINRVWLGRWVPADRFMDLTSNPEQERTSPCSFPWFDFRLALPRHAWVQRATSGAPDSWPMENNFELACAGLRGRILQVHLRTGAIE